MKTLHASIEKKLNDCGRCLNCAMRLTLCLCDQISPINVATRVLIIMHTRETKLFSNTARLANKMLINSEILLRGTNRENKVFQHVALDPQVENLVLYPTKNARVLDDSFLRIVKKPICLIVPDGNWRQAYKVPKREPSLQGLQCVTLKPGPPSQYHLRVAPQDGYVCTYEAIARALGVIEGKKVQKNLETIFELMIERVLWSRSKIKAENCRHPIPAAALLEAKLSGYSQAPRLIISSTA